jgi:hypothetical protein
VRVTLRGEKGLTLLEIVISMALTGLGVLCLAGLLKVLGDVEAKDSWDTKALFCAQEGMEELRFEVAVGDGPTGDGEEVIKDGAYRGMWRRYTVTPSLVFDGLSEVGVECAYSWKGSRKTVRLLTLVFGG